MRGRISGMNESEARAKARAVIFAKTGVNTDPDSTVFKNIGGQRTGRPSTVLSTSIQKLSLRAVLLTVASIS